jgi:hypothetical protein
MIIEPLSAARLNIPDDQYPKTEIVRLFLSQADAQSVISKLRSVPAPGIVASTVLDAVPVPLLATIKAVAETREAGSSIGFAVYGPNEVFDFEMDRGADESS